MQALKPLAVALRGKGLINMIKRIWTINQRYGITPGKMDRSLALLADILDRYEGQATLPITAVALGRNGGVIQKYQKRGIEFAIHGCYHVDHSLLSLDDQQVHFEKAGEIFNNQQINYFGFRSPYLRWNDNTLDALAQRPFTYDSSPSLYWEIDERHITEGYRRGLEFYGAEPAATYLSLPYFDEAHKLVRIPYALPDDESLIERLEWDSEAQMDAIWPAMFDRIHANGELFNLGLHPERTRECSEGLIATFERAAQVRDEVWFTRLTEVTDWWQARYNSQIEVKTTDEGLFQICVEGPAETTLLVRNVTPHSETERWFNGYAKTLGATVLLESEKRPLIGLAPESADTLKQFLREQGYLTEESTDAEAYSFYLNRPTFTREEQRPLVEEIERSNFPLVRLGRWPNGKRSALVITGDIDALTVWDYFLRAIGR